MSKPTKNSNLSAAKKAKNDEFYTQFYDIEKEMSAYLDFDKNVFRNKTILLPCDDPDWSNFTKYFTQNFHILGLKKLISTCYAQQSPKKGKIFTLTRSCNVDGVIDLQNLEWQYLEGNGDFRSDEIKVLRDEADIIITNPPFSLFREFLAWVMEANKKFSIICSMNVISYKDVFPLIANNKIWLGYKSGSYTFKIPKKRNIKNNYIDNNGNIFATFGNICWLTNLDLNIRHNKISLSNKFKDHPYKKYDNYDAIEIPKVKDIPFDYTGCMGVPITFLCKYNPEQFEILGADFTLAKSITINGIKKENPQRFYINKQRKYARIIIKHKEGV